MQTPTLATLLKLINEQYVSLSEPIKTFGYRFYENRPCPGIEVRLQEDFDLWDDSDPNYESSIVYLLRRKEAQKWEWALELSLLGSFAVLRRLNPMRPPLTVNMLSGEWEEKIVRLLDEYEVCLLDQELLEYPIGLTTEIAEEGHVYLYHALIADVATLPWKTPLNDWWPLNDEEWPVGDNES